MAVPATQNTRAVQIWLYAVAALIFLTLIVGGATRLTESGLSITEWKPVTGVLPPMSEFHWQSEFGRYQEIPQYRELNRGMTLGQFKTIYWWEWTHRLLARLVGAAFLLPFMVFLWRGMIPARLRARLWLIFIGGAALGVVGWWMVASGLTGTRVRVAPAWLAFHLTLASTIYVGVVWTARELSPRSRPGTAGRLRIASYVIAMFVLLQIYLGALVAGTQAGMIYNTWPDIDGGLILPTGSLWFESPWWRNLFENTLTVQFDHRMVAYVIWLLAVLHAFDAWRRGANARVGAVGLAVLVTAQAALGIITLLNVAPLGLSLAHQGLAIVVLTAAVLHAESLRADMRATTVSRDYPVEQGAKAT